MSRKSFILVGIVIGFFGLLSYLTFTSTSLRLGEADDAIGAATRECQRAVRESVADARFPFAAKVTDLQGGRLQLTGSIDSGRGLEAERRNYVCVLSPTTSSGEYVADTVQIWKSH